MSAAEIYVERIVRGPLITRKPPTKAKETKPKFTDAVSGKAIRGLPAPAPCPFCKRNSCSIFKAKNGDNIEESYYAQCGYCGSEGPYASAKREAANFWNSAATADPAKNFDAITNGDAPTPVVRNVLEMLSSAQREVLGRGLRAALDNSKTDEEFNTASQLAKILGIAEPAPKQFIDIDDSAPIDGLPEPASCPFCGFHEWTGIVTCPPIDENDIATYHIQCDGCFAEGSPQSTKLEAAQYWNKAAKKVDYSIIEALDDINLKLTHLSELLLLSSTYLREQGVAEDGPVASCLEAAVDAKLEPARERLSEVLQKLSSTPKATKVTRPTSPPKLALAS